MCREELMRGVSGRAGQRRGGRLSILAAGCLAAACEARPIPMQVIPNSSFVLPLQARAFGNAVSKAEAREDYQRGDLIVAICPLADPECEPASGTPPSQCPGVPSHGYYLETRYVTTVMPHPASTAGIQGKLNIPHFPISEENWGLVGQDLAVLEVPSNACPGDYKLTIRTRPVGSPPPYDNEVIYTGGVDVRVLDVPGGTTNPAEAFPFGSFGIDIKPDLADLVPNPTVLIRLQSIASFPAAAEIQVLYPSSSVEILGAYQDKHLGVASMVRWKNGPGTGRVTISVVDPDRCTGEIRLVFRPIGSSPVSLSSFSVVNDASEPNQPQRLYDENGSPMTGNSYVVGDPITSMLICGS